MIEIDFIPEWYRADQNRKRRYHRQYALLGLLLAVLVGWNFVLGRYMSRAKAESEALQGILEGSRQRVEEAIVLQNEISDISRKTSELETIGSRTKATAIVGELSYLTDENVILSKLEFSAELMPTAAPEQAQTPGAVVQVKPAAAAEKAPLPARTKVVLSGIAAKAADAATLIYQLEQSDYFEQVAPVFTRAKTVKENEVTEFEIRCYVADYRLE